jgi:hypothetical protein
MQMLVLVWKCLIGRVVHSRLRLQNGLDARYSLVLMLRGVRVLVGEARGVYRTVNGRGAVIFVQVRNADSTILMMASTLFLLR